MRLLSLFLIACSSTPAPSPVRPTEGVSAMGKIANETESCSNAALGLDRATKGVLAPGTTVFEPMRDRCLADQWPSTALTCFARMSEGELGLCARSLPESMRNAMFAVFGGGPPDRAAIAVARARLELLAVGVAECDQFVTAVSTVLGCERMPIESRVQLGNETADFWDLPTRGLSPEAQQRMATVCGQSLATLQQEALGIGCTP